jgi:protein-L-isoaspartate(D-aspartate) O-methyltransferase
MDPHDRPFDDRQSDARRSMLERQLAARGIDDARVLAAMERVPRDRFVPAEREAEAYSDNALPIDCGQTISQPYIVALMTQALELDGTQRVLEIGTGSGYQTAVLAELAGEVVSVERHPSLSFAAGQVLDELGYGNATLLVGDGTLGYPRGAPYDRVIVTAAAERCPAKLFDQLAEGGLLVIPLGDAQEQTLVAIRKVQGRPDTSSLSPCRFVPLVGAAGWPDASE